MELINNRGGVACLITASSVTYFITDTPNICGSGYGLSPICHTEAFIRPHSDKFRHNYSNSKPKVKRKSSTHFNSVILERTFLGLLRLSLSLLLG